MRMKAKRMTINDLAVMTKRGFDDMNERFATKDDFKVLVDEIRLLRADFRDVKTSMVSFADLAGNHEHELIAIRKRIGMASK